MRLCNGGKKLGGYVAGLRLFFELCENASEEIRREYHDVVCPYSDPAYDNGWHIA